MPDPPEGPEPEPADPLVAPPHPVLEQIRPLAALARRDDALGRAVRQLADSFVMACFLRFTRISGRDRVLVIGGQAFMAFIPLFIVVAAVSPNNDYLPQRIIERFGLTDGAADAVETLFTRPPSATGAVTLIGVVLLFFSILSFTRSLQRTYEASWGLPAAGVRGTINGLSGVGLLIAQVIVLTLLASVLHHAPGGSGLTFVIRVLVAALLWWQLQYLLLSHRVARRELVPGALAAGVGQVAVSVYSGIWMPRLIESNAQQYGVIGVTLALLTWLIVLAFGMVLTAVISAEAGERSLKRQA